MDSRIIQPCTTQDALAGRGMAALPRSLIQEKYSRTSKSTLSSHHISHHAHSPSPASVSISDNPRIQTDNMHLMYTLDASGKRVYTLKKVVGSEVTKSAHPARFSPDDKYSRHRVTLKKRYGLLLTQQSELALFSLGV